MRFLAGALVLSTLWACSSKHDGKSKDTPCRTTADCVDPQHPEASVGVQCVDGLCVRTCTNDEACAVRTEDGAAPSICEANLCVPQACDPERADNSCPAGQSCVGGRCFVYFQSFEAARPGDVVSLENLPKPFNRMGRLLRNKATVVVWTGPSTCGPADNPERCAGVAADGVYYLALERQSTPEHSTPESDYTCGACDCCRKCRDMSGRDFAKGADGMLRRVDTCMGQPLPVSAEVMSCSAAVPAECTATCNACDACQDRSQRSVGFGMGLNACELQAANKRCRACEIYDACVRDKLTSGHPASECDDRKDACTNCKDAADLKKSYPNNPELWRAKEIDCQAAGNDSCPTGPISYPRSELTDDEQATESSTIALSGLTGDLVLQLEYVPFDIGYTFHKVIQGQPSSTWPVLPQRVRIQLCAANCKESSSWVDAKLSDGKDAFIPLDEERKNGLQFAYQSLGDWRVRGLEIPIPDGMRTAGFHFRFLPELDDDARIGVDRIIIRSKQ
ncbi:MAG: hypothetical protein U1E65_29895 [Myxococcota bacterium]